MQMRRALRPLLPALAIIAAAAPPAAAGPRAQSAAVRHAEAALEEVQDLRAGRGVRTGRELTLALRDLSLSLHHLRGEARAEASQALDRPNVGGASDCTTSPDFCVHGVKPGITLSADAVLAVAEEVDRFETGALGWAKPPSDGDAQVDIYLDDVGDDGIFGYAQTDGGTSQSQSSFLVIDDDFANPEFGGIPAAESLRVTLAHEYGHVLQYGYDVLADGWHLESSATWLEQRVYPEIEDWLRYVGDTTTGSGWGSLTELPLTAFAHADDQPRNAKPYGTVVFNHFLAGRYGDALQRRTWELSDGLNAPSTSAYDAAIRGVSGPGISSDFATFSAAAAEWQAAGSGFPLPGRLPEVERRGTLSSDGAPVAPEMDHLTFAFYDVAVPDATTQRIGLAASFPAGARSALALVARTGASGTGEVTTRLTELPDGGVGGVTLDRPHDFIASGGRITAVLVNADTTQTGWSDAFFDWLWQRDDQRVAAAVTSDLSGPGVGRRTPAPDATRVRPRAPIRVTFTKPVTGVDERSFSLRRPDGRRLRGAVTYVHASRTAILVPSAPLAEATRYSVRLTDDIVDASATPLSPVEWSFATRDRAPRARLRVVSAGEGGVLLRLRSRDADRLRWKARLVVGGRRVASGRGRVRPGATRTLRLGTKRTGRARVVMVLRDPQGRRTRIKRSLRLRP